MEITKVSPEHNLEGAIVGVSGEGGNHVDRLADADHRRRGHGDGAERRRGTVTRQWDIMRQSATTG